MIVAKTVVPNQYWILKEDDKKIGNIEAQGGGFTVKINNKIDHFASIKGIKQKISIEFQPFTQSKKNSVKHEVNGYATDGKPYNAIYDIKHRAPLWTKDQRSKSWYAAGWYQIKQTRTWEVIFCPKLILLQRYPYQGPFYTKEQAENEINNVK